MHEDDVSIGGPTVEGVYLVINLVSNSIRPLSIPLYALLILLMPLPLDTLLLTITLHLTTITILIFKYFQIDFIRIKQCSALYFKFLSLAHLEVRLVDIVDEGVPPGGALVEVTRFLKGLHNKVVNQRERHLDLHCVMVLDVHSQILH